MAEESSAPWRRGLDWLGHFHTTVWILQACGGGGLITAVVRILVHQVGDLSAVIIFAVSASMIGLAIWLARRKTPSATRIATSTSSSQGNEPSLIHLLWEAEQEAIEETELPKLRKQVAELKATIGDLNILREKEFGTIGQAAVLRDYADIADGLNAGLEQTWHHWNNAGRKLTHPLASDLRSQIADWQMDDQFFALLDELKQFRFCYRHHLEMVALRFPNFSSNAVTDGWLSNVEYLTLRRNIECHAGFLRREATGLLRRRT